jgi:hypothetical protein
MNVTQTLSRDKTSTGRLSAGSERSEHCVAESAKRGRRSASHGMVLARDQRGEIRSGAGVAVRSGGTVTVGVVFLPCMCTSMM